MAWALGVLVASACLSRPSDDGAPELETGPEPTTAAVETTAETTLAADDTTAAAESTGSPDASRCGLADVAPGAPNPFDIGPNAGQIPPDVGEVLTNNCGCHEVDPRDVTMGAFPYGGMVHFSTIAELQVEHYDPPRTAAALMLERLQSVEPNRMPPPYACDFGDGTVIVESDRQLLIDWLTAGAPDAPNWMP